MNPAPRRDVRTLRHAALGFAALLFGQLCFSPPALAAQRQAGSETDGRSSEADYVIRARVDDAESSELDDGTQKQLTGSLTLTWRNRSGESVDELWFHLYLNAFSNNKSLHLTEAKGSLRGTKISKGYGWQDVTSIRIGDVELIDQMTFRVPNQAAPLDRTLISVALPAPVADGGEVTVELDWESRLPRVRRRTGTKEDFIFLSHWFPKLCVYEQGRGWRAHPFHMNTEFYADYGTYDVTLDLPDEYAGKIAGSGQQVGDPEVSAGRAVTRFVAPAMEDRETIDPVAARGSGRATRVHGFAWTADPDYYVATETFKWDDWASRYELEVSEAMRALDLTRDELRGRDVLMRAMVHPERASQAERHLRATAATLFFYGLWYGPYPYAEITAVDPAWGARAAGGMEYPTIFTCGTRMFTEPRMYTPESVTVHEAGHQFWYGLVGNNEPEAAWLDEGFNSFSDSETLFREYGTRRAASTYSRLSVWGKAPVSAPGGSSRGRMFTLERLRVPNPIRWGMDRVGVKTSKDMAWLAPKSLTLSPLSAPDPIKFWRDQPLLSYVEETSDPRWGDRSGYLGDPDSDPIETKVWDYVDRRSYSTNSYSRTAVSLRSLQAVVGRDAFLRGMRRFAEDWRYRHPYPEDFYLSFQEGADVELQWYFDEVFRGTDTVDWRCSVAQTREPKAQGWFRCADQSWSAECAPGEELADASEEDSDAEEDEGTDASDGEGDDAKPKLPYVYDVQVRRRGGLMLPVDIAVTFDDDSVETFRWTRELQGERNWWRLPIAPGQRKVVSVVIDPERLWFLDQDMSNNQWFAKSDKLAPARWGERALARSSSVLQWFMSIGG